MIDANKILFAVAWHEDNTRTITVFEDDKVCSVELTPALAKSLADMLLIKPDNALNLDKAILL